MKFLLTATGIIVLSLVPLSAPAQEMGYMDLTDNIFRERSRQTRTFGGGCSGSPHTTQASQSEVTASVVSLDKTRYRIGDEATFEIKVMNSGKENIIVPWTPHLGDLEPADPRSSYKYRVGVVLLEFRDPEGLEFSISETLYGSSNVPGSLRELSPGQWFTVKGRKRLDLYEQNWGKKEFRGSGLVATNVSAFYRQDRGAYSPKDGGSDSQWCIPLPCEKSNQLEVIVERP
jgi:hypothetical protein